MWRRGRVRGARRRLTVSASPAPAWVDRSGKGLTPAGLRTVLSGGGYRQPAGPRPTAASRWAAADDGDPDAVNC
ncbi:hypothetical protein L083_2719 [Actinoplanes sp. N902-109]|nr:hypothetical protein L083_2719 [Actinoplanes sp. N902-109]